MFAGFDNKPRLFTTDVTGNYFQYKADAIGENDDKLKEKLRQKYKEGLTCEQGAKLALEIFKEVLGEQYSSERFDVGTIKKDSKLKRQIGKDFS